MPKLFLKSASAALVIVFSILLFHNNLGTSRFQNHNSSGQGFNQKNITQMSHTPSTSNQVNSQYTNVFPTTHQQDVDELPLAVFGYGSLIFKPPPFADIRGRPGYIKGFVRRFNQLSHDHRGTESHPGRVVTLIDQNEWQEFAADEPVDTVGSDDIVWGVMFTYPKESAEKIIEYLDDREKDGYTVRTVSVYDIVDGKEVVIESKCRVYVGETHNPSFAPKAKMQDVAQQIAESAGQSGPNREYLYKLAQAVPSISRNAHDAYLAELYALVRLLDTEEELDEDWPDELHTHAKEYRSSSPTIPHEIAVLWAHYNNMYHSQAHHGGLHGAASTQAISV